MSETLTMRDALDALDGAVRTVVGDRSDGTVDRDVADDAASCSTERMSTAPIAPPASPIAEASVPKARGVFGISKRMISIKPIAGVAMIGPFCRP